MNSNVSILLAGIGGYGNTHVQELLKKGNGNGFCIKGAVDIRPESCPNLSRLLELKTTIYRTMDEFYKENSADLAIISSPIHFHCEQTCQALAHGSSVLCEKPIGAAIQEASRMAEARDRAGRFVAIGYQWSFSRTIQDLKKDIADGLLGRPVRLKTIVLSPRDLDYYKRGWAGKMKDSSGRWVLDSIANNAASHYLHNMFYVLGSKADASARPRFVTAELYRANSIENFDTSVIRTATEGGAEVLFYASHAGSTYNIAFEYEFEKAKVCYDTNGEKNTERITAFFKDGSVKEYGNPNDDAARKLWACVEAVSDKSRILCGIEAASSQTLCINGAQDSMPDIVEFPRNIVKFDDAERCFHVEGLDSVMRDCYRSWTTPADMGIAWARQGKEIDLRSYPGFRVS